MHLPRSSHFIADCLEPLLLYSLVLGQVFLLCRLLEIKLAIPAMSALIIGVPLLIVLLNHAALQARSRCFHMSLLMVVFAHIGILLGAMLDFGPTGLLVLASLCGTLTSLSLEHLWSIVSTAPWTFAGMLLGSNLGMLLSNRMFSRDSHSTLSDMIIYPVCNIGMLVGMVLLEVLVPTTWFTTDPRIGIMVMLLIMLLGMSVGMLLSWWLVGRIARLVSSQRVISQGVTP